MPRRVCSVWILPCIMRGRRPPLIGETLREQADQRLAQIQAQHERAELIHNSHVLEKGESEQIAGQSAVRVGRARPANTGPTRFRCLAEKGKRRCWWATVASQW